MLIQVGTNEILLDDSTRLAKRARSVGVDVILDITADVPHVFQAFMRRPGRGRRGTGPCGSLPQPAHSHCGHGAHVSGVGPAPAPPCWRLRLGPCSPSPSRLSARGASLAEGLSPESCEPRVSATTGAGSSRSSCRMAAPRAAATGTPISPRSADRWSGRAGWPAHAAGEEPTGCLIGGGVHVVAVRDVLQQQGCDWCGDG